MQRIVMPLAATHLYHGHHRIGRRNAAFALRVSSQRARDSAARGFRGPCFVATGSRVEALAFLPGSEHHVTALAGAFDGLELLRHKFPFLVSCGGIAT
jgi:hypothetical protein